MWNKRRSKSEKTKDSREKRSKIFQILGNRTL